MKQTNKPQDPNKKFIYTLLAILCVILLIPLIVITLTLMSIAGVI